jgi:uncharacterized protein
MMDSSSDNRNLFDPHSEPDSRTEERQFPVDATAPQQVSTEAFSAPNTLPSAPIPELPASTTRSIAEDLRVPWDWTDLGLLLLFGAAGFVLISVIIVLGFYKAGITKEMLQQSIAYQSLFAIIAMVFLSLFLLGYLAAQMRLRFRSPVWRTLGWRPLDAGKIPPRAAYLSLIVSGFLLSLLVALASSAFTPKNKMPIEQFLQNRHTALLLLIMSVTLAPLFEETIFRGYIYPVVARTFGVLPGVVFTGLIFGLMHASQLGGNLPQVALLVGVGIVFTAVRARTGNVLPGYILHVSYNSFIVIAFLVASHGLRHIPQV